MSLKIDTRKLSNAELSKLRKQAVEDVIFNGFTQIQACKMHGFTPATMCKYIKDYKLKNEESFQYKNGSKFNKSQEEKFISDIFSHKPQELGISYLLWNAKAIQEYIKLNYAIDCNQEFVRRITKNILGLAMDKPIKLVYERDPELMEKWLKEKYQKIKTKAINHGARIYWVYKSIIDLGNHKKVKVKNQKNLLIASTPQGFLNFLSSEDRITSAIFIDLLDRLIKQENQKLFLICEGNVIYRRGIVEDYIKKNNDKLQLFFLP